MSQNLNPESAIYIYFLHTMLSLYYESDTIILSPCTGVVSHIGYDGPDAWTLEDPDRQFVLDKMVTAIHRWPVDSDRSINYRFYNA